MHLYDNIPIFLKQQPNWVAWGIRDAPLKSPFNPVSLLSGYFAPAKAGEKETWSTYQNAVQCVARGLAKGIGYEFDCKGIYGVDLDHVVDETGQLTPQAKKIVDSLNAYTELSPSGTGLHVWVTASDIAITRHRKKDFFLEIYSDLRYFTVTGNSLGTAKNIENRSQELQRIHDVFFMSEEPQKIYTPPPEMKACTVDADSFLKIGLEKDSVLRSFWNGERRYSNESSSDQAFMNKLAYWCSIDQPVMVQAFLASPYFSQKDPLHKQKCQRDDYLSRTAQKACATVYSTAREDYIKYQQHKKDKRIAR